MIAAFEIAHFFRRNLAHFELGRREIHAAGWQFLAKPLHIIYTYGLMYGVSSAAGVCARPGAGIRTDRRSLRNHHMDIKDGRLLCTRDHMGLRALHYYRSAERFAIATVPEALFALSWVPRVLNKEKLADTPVARGLNGGSYPFSRDLSCTSWLYCACAAVIRIDTVICQLVAAETFVLDVQIADVCS
jgi:hypothetical protein